MNKPEILIHIVASKIACSEGVRDDWRDVAKWLRSKLLVQYPGKVDVKYSDLFDEDCPALPPDSKLPVVMVNNEIFSMGEKISMPLIKKKIESLGILNKNNLV